MEARAFSYAGAEAEVAWQEVISLSPTVKLKAPCAESESELREKLSDDSFVSFGRHAGTLRVHADGPRGQAGHLSALRPADCLRYAKRNPFPVFPHKWACIGWDGWWNAFFGWMLIHVFAGDGSVFRVHVYSREFDENPTNATYKRDAVELYEIESHLLAERYIAM